MMCNIFPEINKFYQHRYGGIYQVNIEKSLSTVDKTECVIYTHVWPFEVQTWHRPISEWTPERFREINDEELKNFLAKDRQEFQNEILLNKKEGVGIFDK